MFYTYHIVSLAYLAAPLVAAALALVAARRTRRSRSIRVLVRSMLSGILLGGATAMVYISLGGFAVPPSQVLMSCYIGIASVCLITGLNWLISRGISRVFGLHRPTEKPHSGAAATLASIAQAALLAIIGLPFLGSVLLLYHPKIHSHDDPLSVMDAPYQNVHLHATDGVPLEAWWIPAVRNRRTDDRGTVNWGHETVLLCHGFGGDKGRDLFLARDLVANGYNVLAIDLRAHGQSGGEFTGFGGIESRDVLGAVRWLQAHRPDESRRIVGLGESLGAVALIEAAADPGEQGQAIDAIAAYDPYDDLPDLFSQVSAHRMLGPTRWFVRHCVVPFASAQIGSNLAALSPATAVRALWPRPILVLGNPISRDAEMGRSYELFRDAMQPRYGYFREDADRDTLLRDKTAALTVRVFFDQAKQVI
jgi:alpha-beta hydrolase superfamily lysophospholipase